MKKKGDFLLGEKEKIVLFYEKSDCCGCMACVNICPKSAIAMTKDENGFLYPEINYDICIGCGQCKRACNFQNKTEKNDVIAAYAAACSDEKIRAKSASGGIFAVIADNILKNNGVVFGCSMEKENGKLYPKHIAIDDRKELHKLQGSKYVQSDIGDSYKQVKKLLEDGKNVFFSGTPCQVAGLYGYLQNKEYDNLVTADIICHGNPSSDLFSKYIENIEHKKKIKIEEFKFRDKKWGWTLTGSISYINRRGKKKSKPIYPKLTSYYKLFLNADVYRDSCYKCKYADRHRPADITLGDFWGIGREHPEYLLENGGSLNGKSGISSVIVNTEYGKRTLENIEQFAVVKESDFTKISNKNGQIKYPSKVGNDREMVFELYKNGYDSIEKWYNKKTGTKKLLYIIYYKIPFNLIYRLKRIARKIIG